jgi:hypothetical protein
MLPIVVWLQIFLLGWKKRAMVEPTAPMPLGRAVCGMVEFWHCRNVGTVARDSYHSYWDHNPQTRNVVELATIMALIDGA